MGDGELAVASSGSAKPGGWRSRDVMWLNQKGIDVRILLLFLALHYGCYVGDVDIHLPCTKSSLDMFNLHTFYNMLLLLQTHR